MKLSEIANTPTDKDRLPHFDLESLLDLFDNDSLRLDEHGELNKHFLKHLKNDDPLWELTVDFDSGGKYTCDKYLQDGTIKYYYVDEDSGLYRLFSVYKGKLLFIGSSAGMTPSEIAECLSEM